MKQQRISICQITKTSWSRLTFSLVCMLCLLNCDAAYCKMQHANRDDDPFAELERENPELFKPVVGSKSKKQSYIYLDNSIGSNNPPETNQFLEVRHERSGKTESKTQATSNNQSAEGIVEREIEQFIQQIAERKRPILPERTKPGGLISSCCSDPYMSSALESYFEAQLSRYNSDDWDRISVADLSNLLNRSLPTYLNVSKLDQEGIGSEVTIPGKIPLGATRVRLQDALRPLGLTYILRRGRLEITTESDVEDGEGITRIYDVTPLVSNVRNGIEQLGGTITASVSPDSWLDNGGSGVLQFHVVPGDREAITTLVLACPSTTHARVQDLLDRLNLLTGSGAKSANNKSAIPESSKPNAASGFHSQF